LKKKGTNYTNCCFIDTVYRDTVYRIEKRLSAIDSKLVGSVQE